MYSPFAGIMLSVKFEQRVNVKFLIKLRKSATETHYLLTEVYRDVCLFRAQVFECSKNLKEGRKISETIRAPVILEHRKLTITLNSYEKIVAWAFEQLLKQWTSIKKQWDRFYMRILKWKRCAKMVTKLLTLEQKETRMDICVDILENIESDPNFLKINDMQ